MGTQLSLGYSGTPDNILMMDWKDRTAKPKSAPEQYSEQTEPSLIIEAEMLEPENEPDYVSEDPITRSSEVKVVNSNGVGGDMGEITRCQKVENRCNTHDTDLVCCKTRKRLGVRGKSGVYRHVYKIVKTWNCPVWNNTNFGTRSLEGNLKTRKLPVAATSDPNKPQFRGGKRLRDDGRTVSRSCDQSGDTSGSHVT